MLYCMLSKILKVNSQRLRALPNRAKKQQRVGEGEKGECSSKLRCTITPSECQKVNSSNCWAHCKQSFNLYWPFEGRHAGATFPLLIKSSSLGVSGRPKPLKTCSAPSNGWFSVDDVYVIIQRIPAPWAACIWTVIHHLCPWSLQILSHSGTMLGPLSIFKYSSYCSTTSVRGFRKAYLSFYS